MATRMMQRPLIINVLLFFLLACQVGTCQAKVTSYTRYWSSSVTTRTYSTSTNRKVTRSHTPKNKYLCSGTCRIKPSAPSGANSVIRKVGNGINDNNCVLFLRQQRGIKLPAKNLSTYASKLSIINAHVPHEKSVAIIKTPGSNARIGHLAEVTGLEEKDGKVTMRLSEANNPKRGYYQRTITGNDLEEIQKKANIVGYYTEPDETVEAQRTPGTRYF